MTSEQHRFSNVWARGSDWWPIRKVGSSKWVITTEGVWALLGTVPVIFKTKRAATAFFNNLAMIRMHEIRAAEAGAQVWTPQTARMQHGGTYGS
jgi:hypothetical protein